MSTASLESIDPIPLTAVISPIVGGGYTLSITCGAITNVTLIIDEFDAWPSSVAVDITSSTVPSGLHLETSGHGTWTTVNSSSLSGTFSGSSPLATFDFTVLLLNGTTVVASSDPRLILRPIGSPLPQ